MNLLKAASENDVEKVREILAKNSKSINVTDNHNFTALHHAIAKQNLEICKLLLNHKQFDCTVRSFEGCTALMIGIMANVPLEFIELLLSHKPSLVTIRNNEEVTPLHEAVKNRRVDIAKALIESGANANDYDLDLENCLHLAASNSHFEMIEFLINETEVDTRAKNRDEMNPLSVLMVRSGNDDEDVVTNCFHLLLEQTYDKNLLSDTNDISDIFQCAFLACVYSHNETVKWIIHNVYSKSNSKYEFIKKLAENCEGDNIEFLYYILVFFHDSIEKYDQLCFPRFTEINYYMSTRSVIYVMDGLLGTDGAVEMISYMLQHMEDIGFNIHVKEFDDQLGVLLYGKYSSGAIQPTELQKIDGIFRYLLDKRFRLNSIVRSFLHSIAIARAFEDINLESLRKILRVLLHYATTFFTDIENWKQIYDFSKLNPQITQIIQWLLESFGSLEVNKFMDSNCVFSLKHISRNSIREKLKQDPNIICNYEILQTLGLPEILMRYLVFKE